MATSSVKKNAISKAGPTKGRKKSARTPALALHAKQTNGDGHIVGLLGLRVVLFEEAGSWFAQGIDIDYLTQGDSIKESKKRFEDGLTATVELHLRKFGNLTGLLKVAPADIQEELENKTIGMRYSQITSHAIPRELPFPKIVYMESPQNAGVA